jgi:protein TonB
MAVVYSTQVDPATRSGFAALVVAAHLALIYSVAVSLGVVEVPPIIKDSELIYISMPKVVEESPPEVKPQQVKPEVVVPVQMPVEAPPTETSPLVEPLEEPQSEPLAIPALPIEAASLSVTKRIEPTYPSASRRAGETGRVQLRVLVDESGHPLEVKVVKSSGFERLDEAAVTAIKRWLFAPARQGSGPVAAWTQVNVTFQLVD